jgi:hypothetical protein
LKVHGSRHVFDSVPELAPVWLVAVFGGAWADPDFRNHGRDVLGLDVPGFLAHSDSAVVLQKGQVVMQGSAANVAANPVLASYLGV